MAKEYAKTGAGVVGGGILAGIIAGIVLAIFAMAYAGATGMGGMSPMRMIAATVQGVDALIGGGGTLALGMLIHLVVSAVFGIIFAALLPRGTSGTAAAGWGVLYGIVIWAGMRYIGVPLVNSTMAARLPMMAGAFFIEHLLFGVTLGITPALVSRLSGQRSPAEVRSYPQRRIA